MAKLIRIEPFGNDLLAIFDDGGRFLAMPTPGGSFIIKHPPPPPPPEPEPEPTPGDGSGKFIWPFDPRPQSQGGTVTEEWFTYSGHRGMDFAVPGGTPIKAAQSGTVSTKLTGYGNGWGNYLRINHGSVLGTVTETAYAHMNAPALFNVGQSVARGQVIGYVGNTGNSRGNHLHFEVWQKGARVNPRPFMNVVT